MSANTPPPRRRRIAGESARPSTAAPTAKPVVKKKVGASKSTPEAVETQPTIRTVTRSSAAKPSAPRPSSDSGLFRDVALLIGAALLIAAGIVAVVTGLDHWRSGENLDARDPAVAASTDAAEVLFSYQSQDFDTYKAQIREIMTDDYYNEAVGDLAAQATVETEAVVRDAALVPCGADCDADQAQILLFVDLDRKVDDGAVTTFGHRVVMDMERVGDDWKVANIQGL